MQKNLRACISIQQRLGLHYLLSVAASLTLKCIMRLAKRILFELEELPKHVEREMSFGVFLLIYNS